MMLVEMMMMVDMMMLVEMIRVDGGYLVQVEYLVSAVDQKVPSVVVFNFPDKDCQRNSISPEGDSFSNSVLQTFLLKLDFQFIVGERTFLIVSIYHCNWPRQMKVLEDKILSGKEMYPLYRRADLGAQWSEIGHPQIGKSTFASKPALSEQKHCQEKIPKYQI